MLSPDAKLKPRIFNPAKLKEKNLSFALYGSRRMGKSWMARYLIHAMRAYFPHGEVFTATSFNGFWQQHFPSWKVFDNWKPGVITAILEEQKQIANLYLRDPTAINPWRLLVLDDCVHDCGRDPLLAEIFQTGRHYYICVIVTTQHPTALLPSIRSNVDVAVFFPIHNELALKTLAETYMGELKTENAMEHLQQYAIKGDHGSPSQCLVVCSMEGGSLADKLYYCQAPDTGKFMVGCMEYWEKKSLLQIGLQHSRVADPKGESPLSEMFEDDEDRDPASKETRRPGYWDDRPKQVVRFRSDKVVMRR